MFGAHVRGRTWVWLGGWPNAPNGQREFGWLSGMNSLQPSWEANEEEAADGGQSAFMRLFGAIEMAYIYIYIQIYTT